jgi:subtilase family serine protease
MGAGSHNGKIISQSWGTAENTLFDTAGQQVLANFESFYQNAAQQNVTVLSGSGDSGSSNIETNQTAYFPFPTVEFPASSPFVTAVGGTSLYADGTGNYGYETAWIGSGGGVSQQFSQPSYQSTLPAAVQQTLANHRGVPDVAFNADPATAILVYTSFIPNASGYYFINGTSEGPPQWAAIIADANQLAGHPLGFLNPKLYALGASGGQSKLFHDITFGSNAFNGPIGVPGYTATTGWDLTTGWGTPNLGKLVWELAKQQ